MVLAAGARLPNLAKIMIPRLVYADWTTTKSTGSSSFRRIPPPPKRLDALRDHHKRAWSVESNPAIQLVTSLMRACTPPKNTAIFSRRCFRSARWWIFTMPRSSS